MQHEVLVLLEIKRWNVPSKSDGISHRFWMDFLKLPMEACGIGVFSNKPMESSIESDGMFHHF